MYANTPDVADYLQSPINKKPTARDAGWANAQQVERSDQATAVHPDHSRGSWPAATVEIDDEADFEDQFAAPPVVQGGAVAESRLPVGNRSGEVSLSPLALFLDADKHVPA